ncbi:MAG TPA: tautomerase family protein [Roseiflexaceae bacterium]|nr:tautomerase family protein [Roseiflexaceae bacterium]
MPLVCISLMEGKGESFGRQVGQIVYEAMMATLNVPAKDHFQIITEHSPDTLIYDPEYLDIPRTNGIIMIQITLNQGRSVDMKKALYQMVAERLHADLSVRKEDVLISLVEVTKENWSFGNGEAQYA